MQSSLDHTISPSSNLNESESLYMQRSSTQQHGAGEFKVPQKNALNQAYYVANHKLGDMHSLLPRSSLSGTLSEIEDEHILRPT